MDEPDPPQIEALCREALARAVEDRADFLAEACQGDVLMRTKIDRLLAETEATASLAPVEAKPPLPDRIGRYHVKRIIATGGMGLVYEAVQGKPPAPWP
jgi:hypothetical protein